MLDQGKAADLAQAMRQELAAAGALLKVQEGLELAIRSGQPAADIEQQVRLQEAAMGEVSRASLLRRRLLDGPGALERFLEEDPGHTSELRRMAREAEVLRGKIRSSARRSEYLANRVVGWTQAQLEVVVRILERQGPTYEDSGPAARRRRLAPFLEKTA